MNTTRRRCLKEKNNLIEEINELKEYINNIDLNEDAKSDSEFKDLVFNIYSYCSEMDMYEYNIPKTLKELQKELIQLYEELLEVLKIKKENKLQYKSIEQLVEKEVYNLYQYCNNMATIQSYGSIYITTEDKTDVELWNELQTLYKMIEEILCTSL